MRLPICAALGLQLFVATAASGADLATGLVGYWKLDESSPTGAAADSSPTGASGAYVNGPAAAADVPALMYADARSVLFSKAAMQAVRVTAAPAALKPPAVTLSAWFKLRTALSGTGITGQADVVSMGDQTLLRVYGMQVEAAKRVAGVSWVPARGAVTVTLGAWHHLAATIDTTRLVVYYDGVMLTTVADTQAITYDLGPDLWIGRHGSGASRDFDGNIDEVAMWSRALTAAEVAALAAGAQPGTVTAPPPPDGSADSADSGSSDAGGAGAGGAGAGGAGGSGGGAGGSGGGAPDDGGPATPPDSAVSVGDGAAPVDGVGSGRDATVDARFGADGARPPPPAGSGCACAAAPGGPAGGWPLLCLAAAALLLLGARRR